MNAQYIERYWRDAKPEDAIKEPPMVARFRDGGEFAWKIDKLISWDRSVVPWVNENHWTYDYCQVYDAPDPGEGWRLVDVEKDVPLEREEIYERATDSWLVRLHTGAYNRELIYRRRIEQPKPQPRYEPFKWVDREQLRGRLITFVDRDRTVEFRCESFAVDDLGLLVNDDYADWLCIHAVFVDTKEPVGKRIDG